MNRCQWHKSAEVPGGRYLVPGCWSRVIYGDDAPCTCPKLPRKLPKEARALLDALAALNLDSDHLADTWDYLARVRAASNSLGEQQ